MRDVWGRLKAALCSHAACVLLAAGLLLMIMSGVIEGSRPYTDLERRIGAALSRVKGAGDVEVIIRTRLENEQEIPCGAVAVAQGAEDPLVKMELTQALCALLGLQASGVSVIGVSGGGI